MKGCALFQFIYPGNIRILPGEAFFDFQGDRFCISVSPHLNAVNTLSVNDKIVRVPAENSRVLNMRLMLQDMQLTIKYVIM
ncbi:hypothetical protein BOO22_20995 [Vibrio cidicii]|uniref:hypothetical protein n=1 Tax=Vibrio cidicii TaxID=1763883 RepID=UPI0018C2B00C|nr:hypothetical protein [Vibrio cidicii]MBG0761878.1 hypothetical protein [Vibrio cidicii]